MAAYVDFNYYAQEYGGAAIPSSDFEQYALQASRRLDALTRYQITEAQQSSNQVRNAACAVADLLYAHQQEADKFETVGVLASEKVGDRSESYRDYDAGAKRVALNSAVNTAARSHLAGTGLLYGGVLIVGGC